MLDTVVFDSGKKGPSLLILGSVHGNEKCGTHAIGRAIMELRSGIFSLSAGKVIFVPICNPEAYRLNQRYFEVNLNRVVCKHDKPALYEHKIANELTDIIKSADLMLDLHSYSSGVKPFLFVEYGTPEERAFATAMRIPHWVTGWNALYHDKKELWEGDTCTYAFQQGKLALLVECGQHDDPEAAHVGYRCIRRAFAHFGLTEAFDTEVAPAPQICRLHSVHVKRAEGKMVKPWQHLDTVAKGTPVLRYDDGETITSPVDGIVVMPVAQSKIGEEWIFFGVQEAA
ncbi:MAG: succinylglutamate desuccinylase/aspartoacylase family protein [Alphaproteobacteria bacterium]